ncbi:hypothetical protein BH24ACT7_BH24ACT7_04440 [soil metagenome]
MVDGGIAVTEPVMMEVLAGALDEGSADGLRRLLFSFEWIPLDPATDFEGAAVIYRACRRAGITPGRLVDCLVANVALRTRASLLTADEDFARMASVARCGSTRVEPPES